MHEPAWHWHLEASILKSDLVRNVGDARMRYRVVQLQPLVLARTTVVWIACGSVLRNTACKAGGDSPNA